MYNVLDHNEIKVDVGNGKRSSKIPDAGLPWWLSGKEYTG